MGDVAIIIAGTVALTGLMLVWWIGMDENKMVALGSFLLTLWRKIHE